MEGGDIKPSIIYLFGNIPSKKNSRINTRTGKSFPSTKFVQWQNDAILQIKQQTRERWTIPVKIDVEMVFGKNIRCDLDNRLSSILDMLVKMEYIPDDKFQDVPEITIRGRYEKGEYKTKLTITPILR